MTAACRGLALVFALLVLQPAPRYEERPAVGPAPVGWSPAAEGDLG